MPCTSLARLAHIDIVSMQESHHCIISEIIFRITGACLEAAMSSASSGSCVPLIAAACGEIVVIFSSADGDSRMEALSALQPMAGAIRALQWDTSGRQLACLCERQVVVYRRSFLTADADALSWDVAARLPSAGASAVGWIRQGNADSLAIAREALHIHRISASSSYTCSPTAAVGCDGSLPFPGTASSARGASGRHISHMATSPDGRWLASACRMGRMVTVTQMEAAKSGIDGAGEGGAGRTILLGHPRAVTCLSWMPSRGAGASNQYGCLGGGVSGAQVEALMVLLTACQDGQVRIYRENPMPDASMTMVTTLAPPTPVPPMTSDQSSSARCKRACAWSAPCWAAWVLEGELQSPEGELQSLSRADVTPLFARPGRCLPTAKSRQLMSAYGVNSQQHG
jgi:hypothetical protein